jgi:catechol-2,3-dioxygenase
MIKIKQLVHFSIPVTDLGKSERFYADVLGMKRIDGHQRMVFLRIGNDHIVLVKSAPPRTDQPHGNTSFRPGVHHAFLVDPEEYDTAKTNLSSRGIPILGEELRNEGVFTGRSLYFSDPDGNELEIIDRIISGPAKPS